MIQIQLPPAEIVAKSLQRVAARIRSESFDRLTRAVQRAAASVTLLNASYELHRMKDRRKRRRLRRKIKRLRQRFELAYRGPRSEIRIGTKMPPYLMPRHEAAARQE